MPAGGSATAIACAAIDEHGALQKYAELAGLLALLKRDPPRRVLEIGAGYGGTLWAWRQVTAPDAQVICVDLGETDGQRLDGVTVLRDDSHNWHVRGHVDVLLAGAPLDFLFVDGDHIQEGVEEDWRMYGPLVRPGGIVAFHDTAAAAQVAAFWTETILRTDHDRLHIYDNHEGAHGGGIGVVFM